MRKVLLVIAAVLTVAVLYILVSEHRRVSTSGGLAVAEKTWGDVCGVLEPDVKEANLPGNQAGESVADWLELPTGKQYTKCQIKYDRKAVDGIPGVSYERALCATLIHEYGHLANQDHSSNPDSVMYYKLTKRNIPDDC